MNSCRPSWAGSAGLSWWGGPWFTTHNIHQPPPSPPKITTPVTPPPSVHTYDQLQSTDLWKLSTILSWPRRSFLVRWSSMRASTRHSMKCDRYCGKPRLGNQSLPIHSWFISPNANVCNHYNRYHSMILTGHYPVIEEYRLTIRVMKYKHPLSGKQATDCDSINISLFHCTEMKTRRKESFMFILHDTCICGQGKRHQHDCTNMYPTSMFYFISTSTTNITEIPEVMLSKIHHQWVQCFPLNQSKQSWSYFKCNHSETACDMTKCTLAFHAVQCRFKTILLIWFNKICCSNGSTQNV